LALVGIYGTVWYTVAPRRLEFGVRLASGVAPGALAARAVGRSLRPALAGIAAGFVLGALALRPLAAFLFGANPLDPLLLLGVLAALLAAAFLPARRAARAGSLAALRCE
jgi:ABC-type antimicrobial peptide transport system permease subunit